MKVLVTGSMGTIGKPLLQKLEQSGHDVYGTDLFHSDRVKYMRTDIREYRQVERLFEQDFDMVYHLAAEFGRMNGEEYYENLWHTNVIGTRHILEIQKIKKFKLVFASSSESYGNLDVDFMTEDLLSSVAVEHHNDYAITKYVNEKQVSRFVHLYDSQSMICRFFNAYGPGEYYSPYRSVVCLFCYRVMNNLPITVYKDYHRVFMYVDDFIDTLVRITDNFVQGEIVNIGGTEYRNIQDLSDLVHSCLGKAPDHVIYQDKELANVTNKRPSIEKAVKLLGHNPITTLEIGVPKTIEWLTSIYGNNK